MLKFATIHPVAFYEYSVPIGQISLLANNAQKFTPFAFEIGLYFLADEVFGGYLEAWKITVKINRQQKSCYELWHCEAVRAFADVGDSKPTYEI